ncbi:SHUGOSHIN 1 [Cynara cardunculus var. scolymus]|uniref:SHUGOSHIN 1 n=1 Tax=Cynara cardunculus var. scolymus TaxID=59895 RepID=UPI000D6281F2|nr:SHUGOSHIN 1 [Cynara cardunculus var. scolymus]
MEDLSVYDSKTSVIVGGTGLLFLCANYKISTEIDKPKIEEKAKLNMRSSGRRTLADISNIPQRFSASNQDNKPQPSSDAIREYIKQLQKENAALMKLLIDKNRSIELGGAEVQKLRVILQKVQQQNLLLAQSNSQMLVELNSVKERQKALKHELGCKDGLIIAKKLEPEGNPKARIFQANDSQNDKVTELEETEACTVAESNDHKRYNTSRMQKSKSLVSSDKKVQDNEVGKARRIQTRRQSSRLKHDEPKSTKSSFEIENVDDLPPCSLLDDDKSCNPVPLSSNKEGKSLEDYKPQEQRKTSLSRPLREAAKKVQSYKEINVNVKMRRNE